jgi:cytochrome c-type biogenesis protein CcmH
MMRFIRLVLLVVVGMVVAVALPGGTVFAQDPTPTVDTSAITDDQVNAVAQELYCPVCENIPLDVCPTQACTQWRELIRLKLAQGWTKDAIKDYFAQQYGDRVLAAPPARGLNWLVYILPPVILVAGVILVYRVLHSMRKGNGSTSEAKAPAPDLTNDAYAARLEEELKKRR